MVLSHKLLKGIVREHSGGIAWERRRQEAFRKRVLLACPPGEQVDLSLRCDDAPGGFAKLTGRDIPPRHLPQHIARLGVEVRKNPAQKLAQNKRVHES